LYYVGQVKETNGNVFIQKSEPFSVKITNNCINPAIYSIPIADQIYPIGTSALAIYPSAWSLQYSYCGSLTYSAWEVSASSTEINVDSTVVKFTAATRAFTIFTTNLAKETAPGTFITLRLKGVLTSTIFAVVDFKL